MKKELDVSLITRQYRERLLKDPWRPGYHFCVPDGDGRPGDPNGCFYAQGRHHLMYLYKREDRVFCWGHVSSRDLCHWRHHQDALFPCAGDEGCFSGGAFVDEDGTAYLSFWIYNNSSPAEGEKVAAGIGLAKSRPPYEVWERMDTVAIPSVQWGIARQEGRPVGCADPSNIWKAGGTYYMQTGNLLVLNAYGRGQDAPEDMQGDWTELFSSPDLRQWTYEGRFYQRRQDNAWTQPDEDDMCPSFLPLPPGPEGGAPTGQYLQLFISHNRGCQYYIGGYHQNRFTPMQHGRMTWTDSAFFAPEAYLDEKGRQIMFAWLRDNLPEDYRQFGWSGAMSLPRVLWLREDGGLGLAPAPEVDALAYHGREVVSLPVAGEAIPLPDPGSAKIRLTALPGEKEHVGLILAKGDSAARIYYNHGTGRLVFDASCPEGNARPFLEEAPFSLLPEETLDMTVYIDRSVVEVFVNGRQAITRRVYQQGGEDLRLLLTGRDAVQSLCTWEMAPSQPY